MSIMNRLSRIFSIILILAAVTGYAGHAQGTGEDPIGFKGGYKALSRLCETNLDGAARLLANDYSRGYFVSLQIPAGIDTITDITFLTAASPELAREIAWALKETNGKWLKRDKTRKLLIPIFFCQNTPPNDSLFSQLLVANNAGFNVPGSPDQWPEAAEGIWIHPICPLVAGHAPRAPMQNAAPSGTAAAPVQQTAPSPSSPSIPVPDSTMSSGIYLTQADFDAGMMTYPSTFPIEEKGLISWSSFDYATRTSTIRARTSTTIRDYKEFPAGSIFGFRNNNIKYIYLKSAKGYLSVVYKGSPFCLFMSSEKQTGIGDGTQYGVFQFARTLDGPLKEFTRKRIDEEFGSNPKMAADLQILRKELEKHSTNLSPEGLRFCKQLAKDSLSKYAN
jgi:hypothetical protein